LISTLTIQPLPPTLNQIIDENRKNRYIAAKTKKEESDRVAIECYAQALPRYPGKVWLEFCWHVSNFGTDPDNVSAAAKYILDGMVQAEVLTKDSLMTIQSPYPHWFYRCKKGEERVEIVTADFDMHPELKPWKEQTLSISNPS
jgi:hypothetical protein